ncbi:phage tail protein [Lewinellaceae bacterium SD302]|nr:phage tail protein [Lewinellaceae bacterium SD302]
MSHPLPSHHFVVEWGGTKICFTKVRNLAMRYDVIRTNCGSKPVASDSLQQGRQHFENFHLERNVVAGDIEFYDWWRSEERRDIVIKLLNTNHEPVISWRVLNALPVRLSYSDLDASTSDVLIESLEIASEGISIVN